MAQINTPLSPQTSLALMQATQNPAFKPPLSSHVDEAAENFEAMFVTEMIKPMFETIGIDENFGGGKGEEVFRDFMTDEYGKLVARAGGVGLAAPIKDALIKAQAEQNNAMTNPIKEQ